MIASVIKLFEFFKTQNNITQSLINNNNIGDNPYAICEPKKETAILNNRIIYILYIYTQ